MINHACDLEAYWNRPFCLSNNEWADSDCEFFIFLPWSSQWPASLRLGYWIYFFFKKSLGDCDYCRWSSNYWNMWTGSPSPPPCVEEEALPAFCPVPLVARKQLSNFKCFAVYENVWQAWVFGVFIGKSVFYLRFSAIKPTKSNLEFAFEHGSDAIRFFSCTRTRTRINFTGGQKKILNGYLRDLKKRVFFNYY